MAEDKHSTASRPGELHRAAVDSAVNVAKAIHELSRAGALPDAYDPRASARLAFKLAELGVSAWRDVVEIHRKAYPELLSVLLPPNLTPELEGALVSDEAIVDVKLKEGAASFQVHVENRSRRQLHVVLPRTLRFERRDRADQVILELTADPYAPLLGPGDRMAVSFALSDARGDMTRDNRYHAELELRSRCGRRATVMLIVRT